MQIFGMAGAVCDADHDSGSVVVVTEIVEVVVELVEVVVELVVDDEVVSGNSTGHPTNIPHINNEITIITKFFIFVYVTKLVSGIRTLSTCLSP